MSPVLTSQLIRERIREERPSLLIEVSAGGEDVDELLKTMARTLPATYDASRMNAPALAFVAVHRGECEQYRRGLSAALL
ncbi:MAG: hypothetical protein IPJ98_16205 [Bryobacterales bacterium]|nr:hypothetical protein [Bryobacterales bacterium]